MYSDEKINSIDISTVCMEKKFRVKQPSTRSLPAYRNVEKNKLIYKTLSSLLHSKNKPFHELYQILEKTVEHVNSKQSTPKVTLYVHSSAKRGSNNCSKICAQSDGDLIVVGGLICKSILMENSPFSNVYVTFVDGICLEYQVLLSMELCTFRVSKGVFVVALNSLLTAI